MVMARYAQQAPYFGRGEDKALAFASDQVVDDFSGISASLIILHIGFRIEHMKTPLFPRSPKKLIVLKYNHFNEQGACQKIYELISIN
jgi:hypothetical protein